MLSEWIETRVRRYEHGRWASEKNRKNLPFSWGLEHIGGRANEPEPRAWLENFVARTLPQSNEWFSAQPMGDYVVTPSAEARGESAVLTFTSAIDSPYAVNNTVHARFFAARTTGPAAIVMSQWNAKWHEQVSVCRWLQKLGISALRLSLPYHDRRAIPDHPRGDNLVGPNIGLTIQANRQAVCDARACLRWLESQGYHRLGVLGTSVGSSISFITLAHEPALRAGAFLHASTYFGDVVANGLTTTNVWEQMRNKLTALDLRRFWEPISPFPYIGKLRGANKKILAITGDYDPTFWPELTEELLAELRAHEVGYEHLHLPCGHYSMGEPPFSYIAGFRFGSFLFQALS
jgi:dienelactone hydrolase